MRSHLCGADLGKINYLLFRVGDWAVLKIDPERKSDEPVTEEVIKAGYFDEEWKLREQSPPSATAGTGNAIAGLWWRHLIEFKYASRLAIAFGSICFSKPSGMNDRFVLLSSSIFTRRIV